MDYVFMGKELWMWLVFLGVVITLLVLDLGVLHKKQKEIEVKESLYMSGFYITIGLLFGAWIWYSLGETSAKEYVTGFLVEKTLALDNIFLISLIFTFFAIPRQYQHRVLFWGILGVVILRGIMIALGATLVAQYSWVMYIFAVFLILTGVKMLFMIDSEPDIANNPVLKLMKKYMRITPEIHKENFMVQKADPITGKLKTWFTPLFAALVLIEIVDLIFAVDSVPAIFTITQDPYIVYTSNIFAILGLRALYFALDAVIHKFKYLKYALAFVLIFIGSKTFIAYFMGLQKFPASISLGVTFGLILGGVLFSLYMSKREELKLPK
jgi:tellurite resistance protein TerC